MPSPRLMRSLRLSSILLCLLPSVAFGQSSVLQGGSWTEGHVPAYAAGGSGSQPIVIDSGGAGGTVIGQGVSELNVTARCTTPPCAGAGTGPDGTIFTINDAVSNNSTGGHSLAFSANALGGGLLEYGPFGTATALPLRFKVNGTTYQFPFSTSGVVGPGTSVVGHVATWANTSGTLLADSGLPLAIGGTSGQIQFNLSGSLAGFTLGGDATVNTGTGALTITKIGGQNATLGGALSTGGAITTGGVLTTSAAFSTVGNDDIILTTTASTNVTLPITGTLATLAGSEALTGKTYNGLTINSTTGTLALTNAKTLTVQNTMSLAGTDGSTLNIGAGGTLGTAAYTAASAYVPSNSQISSSLSGDVAMTNTANYFDGPTIVQGSTGTWLASGTVTLSGNDGDDIYCKLWDGSNVFASAETKLTGVTAPYIVALSLSGFRASPAGNIRISCRNITSVATTAILFNGTGNARDSTVTAFRTN